MMTFHVRTGLGTVTPDGKFTDTVELASRAVRQHSRWQSVTYKGKRYQLHGGVYTDWFICLNTPIKGKGNR